MNRFDVKHREFRKELEKLSRNDLLEILEAQDPDLVAQVRRIEWVFATKLTHLTWDDGTPIKGRRFTKAELALLIDPVHEPDPELTQLGISHADQEKLHYASDVVLWSKHYLGAKPRVYQILILRHPSNRKVLRAGRRLGKTVSMALLALYRSFTIKQHKTIVVAPMKSHVKVIFDAILEWAGKNSIVKESITRDVQSPNFEIEFSNGSTIRLFTSGMKSGGRSDVVRGQEAHLVILDELDYMADEDLDALYAMLQKTSEDQADKMMLGASTPSGRKATFWDWCHNGIFKEFWFPSYCNPFFDAQAEAEQRAINSEMAYRHEIEADWGEDTEGVFPRRFVDAAFIHPAWPYVPDITSARSFFVMGVDWNKYAAGVNIVLLEVCGEDYEDPRFQNRIRLAYREEVIREAYTLTDSVDRIIYLNRVFRPKHIYVDSGFGETQVELLHKYGSEHPESGLQYVKPVGYGTMEIPDHWTRQKVKKDVKPFLIDNMRTMLERGQLVFPGKDPKLEDGEDDPNYDDELYYDLISYVVSRTTSTGRPIFESTGGSKDHIIDAIAFACLAIEENYGELLKIDYAFRARAFNAEVVSPLLQLSENKSQRKIEENIIEEKWGDPAKAPVMFSRPKPFAPSFRHNRSRPIRRKMF